MQRIIWAQINEEERRRILARPPQRAGADVASAVAAVFNAVRERGEAAVRDYSLLFDGAEPDVVEITEEIVADAKSRLEPEDLAAMTLARDNIVRFHEATRPRDVAVETAGGVCRRVYKPIGRVGIYAPGGSAPLFSSLLMTAIPAKVAGVPEIIVATPPFLSAAARDLMIVAARLAGVERIFVVGGAQAIAAMTYGAGAIPPVDKIFGPGGAYVAAAKAYAASLPGGPAIDLPAGPSELMVIADGEADPEMIAADLLSQAEHDPLAQVLLVVTDEALADAVAQAVEQRVGKLPRRDIARASLGNGRILIVETLDEAVGIANAYAPEHLSLALPEAARWADKIANAGAVFVGAWAAETFGDYVSGPSHVLPTDRAARAWSGVSTEAFMRALSIQEIGPECARATAEAAARLARLEGLEAHAQAADARLNALKRREAAA